MAFKGIINPNQIRHEIETLKSQKQEIEARISLLESQLHQQHSSCTSDSCPPISAVQVSKKSQRRLCEQPLAEIGEKRRRTTETEMSERQEENKKPGDQAAYIKLTVSNLDGNDTVFRMKRSTKLKKLMNAYCALHSVDFSSIVFVSNVCRRIYEHQTPDQLEMEDGDDLKLDYEDSK